MKRFAIITLIALFSLCVISASAQTKKIGMKRAKAIAGQQVQGKFKSSELEKEKGKWIYSFDMLTKEGKTMEVNIDAYSGAVVSVDEESAENEAEEKAAEKAEKAEKKKPE